MVNSQSYLEILHIILVASSTDKLQVRNNKCKEKFGLECGPTPAIIVCQSAVAMWIRCWRGPSSEQDVKKQGSFSEGAVGIGGFLKKN